MKFYDTIKKPKFMLQGVATLFPGRVASLLPKHQAQFRGDGVRKGQNINDIVRSCYGTWMRFFVAIHKTGVQVNIDSVAEIGPGDSLGMGMCALLSGSKHYFALDVVRTAYNHDNEEVLEELVKLFKSKSPIPDETELPKNIPRLSSYKFPSSILTDELLKIFLADERLDKIKKALKSLKTSNEAEEGGLSIKYIVPWTDPKLIEKERVDLLFSCAVMEHVDDLDKSCGIISVWLKTGGLAAHAIDYKCHGTSSLWNGHWTYSNLVWRIIRGKLKYFINRIPHSIHVKLMKNNNLKIIDEKKYFLPSEILRKDLATQFKRIEEEDLTNSDSFIVGQKWI